jgi:hypothetical protein
MPALVVVGHRFPLVAEDDVRTMSKYALMGRIVQVGLLVPSILFVLHERMRPCLQEEEESSNIGAAVVVVTAKTVSSSQGIILRTFVFLSMVTIFVSCLLDTVMYVRRCSGSCWY